MSLLLLLGGAPTGDATANPDPIAVVVTMPAVTASGSGDATASPATISVVATLPASFAIGQEVIGLWATNTTLFPPRVGVTVDPENASDTHTVISGVSSLQAGAGTILTGDYAFRGLYSTTIDADIPGDFVNDARGWVYAGQWGDFTLGLRREVGNIFSLRAEWVTAATDPTWAQGVISLPYEQTSLGLGATRDATTGEIELWRSNDGWVTWTPVLIGSDYSFVAGALPDSAGEAASLLSGDLQDGPWISIYQAQWGATTDITDVDADEVAAWNYGAAIVTGVGGDFYDSIDQAVLEAWEFGQNASFVYSMRSETTDAGTTIRIDWTTNAATLATGTPTAGTESAFTLDLTPQWEEGPGSAMTLPPVLFTTTSSFTALLDAYSAEPGGFGDYNDDGEGPRYRVHSVDHDGVSVDLFENAIIGDSITWSLNEVESFDFKLPTLDVDAVDAIVVGETEVQVWRGTKLLVWGVVVRSKDEDDGTTIEYQCLGLGWYLGKRRIGGPRVNWINDPSFETGAGFWFHERYHLFEPTANRNPAYWTQEVTSERSVAGYPGRSLKLSSTDDMIFGINSFTFTFQEVDPVQWPDGIVWTAAAWCYVPSVDWVKERPAAYVSMDDATPSGLHILRSSTTEFLGGVDGAPKLYEAKVASIDADTPKDTWVRLEVSITQPIESATETRTDWIQVELNCPVGTVFWDEVSLTRDDRLFFNEVDQATIVANLVAHAQSSTYGKSDLNIGANCPLTGVLRTRTYEFFQHTPVDSAIEEFPNLWDGLDWSMEVTQDQRFFTTHFPRKGTHRPLQALITGRNIAAVTIADDGEQKASNVTVLSDWGGTGASREEVLAVNASMTVTLEEVINSVPEAPLNSLIAQAELAMRDRSDVRIPVLTTYENLSYELLGKIQTGDVVPVDVRGVGRTLQGNFRIMAITLHPSNETMDITLNPYTDFNDPTLGGT